MPSKKLLSASDMPEVLGSVLTQPTMKIGKKKCFLKSAPVKTVADTPNQVLAHLKEYEESPHTIIESYFKGNSISRLVRHQIESYNHFIGLQIHRTISQFNPITIHSENDYVVQYNKYLVEVVVSFNNLKMHQPQIHENNGATKVMLPQEARLRNFTYASAMSIDVNVKYIIRNSENMDDPKIMHKTLSKINLGKMPIMLKSDICVLSENICANPHIAGECPMDCGGYFIIKGSEKIAIGQERAAENRIYCFDSKNQAKGLFLAEIKSVPDSKCISPKQVEMVVSKINTGIGHGIYVSIPRIKSQIELFAVFRAMGVVSDKSICEYIMLNTSAEDSIEMLEFLRASIILGSKYHTREDAMRHVTSLVAYTPINMDKETGARKKKDFAQEVINSDLFPHCNSLGQKAFFLGKMANKLIKTALGWLPSDDRDSCANKRIDTTGTLLNNLFRNLFNKMTREMNTQIMREINTGSWRSTDDYENIINSTNIYKIIKSSTIESGINRSLSTGDFSVKHFNGSKVGVAQVLKRLTYLDKISHIRRINTPIDKNSVIIPPRKLHGTTWGFMCPVETPEGAAIGIVKNLSNLAHITTPSNSAALYSYILPMILRVEDTTPTELFGKVKVIINGSWVGVSNAPIELYLDIKDKKCRGIINIYTSVIFDYGLMEIRVCNDGGRLSRPVLRVKNNRVIITTDVIDRLARSELGWNDLLTNCTLPESVIEYIDPEEQNFAMIAIMTKDGYLNDDRVTVNYTHCEIHSSVIFGVLASCIPFPEHNQSPRNVYQCLAPDTLVAMANGGAPKAIRDVCVGDNVLTFCKSTLCITPTEVVHQFVRPAERPIYRVLTEDCSVVATDDHKFMTSAGMRSVAEMIADPKLALMRRMSFGGVFDYICKNVPVISITPEPAGDISCITVESENSTFVLANGLLSSNCAMSKQSIGVYATNFDQRMDRSSYVLTYPMRPLVDTRLSNMLKLDRVPSGEQIHVAIMSYTGYNQEDSVLISQGAIDRGMFTATIYHTEKDEDKNIVRDEIIRCKPVAKNTHGMKFGNYDKLTSDGFIPVNTIVENRDVIIAKMVPVKENRNDPMKLFKFEDQSKTYRTTEETYIDRNFTGRNGDGYNFAKTLLRVHRKPCIGDKFASRAAQKGTCGLIIPESDMPFTKDGLRPDIILNPHAIPSRMTIAQLKETILGKVLVELGLFGDGTACGSMDTKTIVDTLQGLGYESYGNEIMYDGLTGAQMDASIFIGPVYYQRLKHMVNDKQHSRAIGPMVNLTRQPAEGRSRDGGFRIGEMERDVMLAHGISQFCRERLYSASDKYSVHVCKKCGMMASYNDGTARRPQSKSDMTIYLCNTCENTTHFARVEIPYAFKLLSQELQAINVVPRIITE